MARKTSVKDKLIFYEQLCEMLDDLRIGAFTTDANRKITYFNRAAETLMGYKGNDAVGKYCNQVFGDELCSGECKFYEAVEAEPKSLSCEVKITDRQHERRSITKIVTPFYDANSKLMGCIEIFQDHSAFKDLIERIRYDDRRLKIILDNLDIGVLTVDCSGHVDRTEALADDRARA